ncbi:MAG: extracellular solute-binding protein [Chloroflexi bacterium]|nr:extracellular solute-binding protein [Chloroflexota bacterium]
MIGPHTLTRRLVVRGTAVGAGAALLAATGCSPGGTGTAQSGLPLAGKPTGTIEFWQGWSTRTPQLRVYLDRFEQQNPGVKVADIEANEMGGRAKWVSSIIAGTMPDCLMVFKDMYPLVVPAKVMVGLNKYVARDKVNLKEFIEADVKDRTFDGELVALPSASGLTAGTFIYWNKDHFRQVGLNPEQGPRTWSEVEQFVAKLHRGPDQVALNPGGRFLSWFYANNGRFYSDDGKKVAFDSAEARDTLRWLAQLVQRQGSTGELLERTGTSMRSFFYQGKYSMYLEIDLFPSLLRVDPIGQAINWGIGVLPYNDRNARAKYVIPSRGGHGYGVTSGARNPEGAWALAKYLTLSDAQCEFMTKDQGRVSTLKRCNTDPEALKKPEFQVFSKQVNSVLSLPFNPGDDKAVAALEKYAQEAVLGKTSPDAAILNAVKEAQLAIDEGWAQWRS